MTSTRSLVARAAILVAAAGTLALAGGVCLAQPAAEPAPDASEDTEHVPTMSMLQLLVKGGVIMIPIGLCSLVGLAIVIERFIALRRGAIMPRGFMDGLRSAYAHGSADRRRGIDYCRTNDCPLARLAAAGIRKLHRGEEEVEQAIADAGANEVAKLRRHLRLLYSIAAVAPMLGLLGTVWGMILAFQVASHKGLGKVGALARGIYEALVTTFGGLIVAIPILVFYYYFLGRIERIVSEMNDISVEFIEHYTPPAGAGAAVA